MEHLEDAPPPPDDEYTGTGELTDVVIDVAEKVGLLTAEVETHAEALGEISQRLEELAPTMEAGKPDPWNLRDASPDEMASQWERVAAWVTWYNTAYAPNGGNDLRVPECWFLHPHGRMILLDLFYAWRAAQYSHRGDSSDAVYWDTVYLPNALRLAAENNGWGKCKTNHDPQSSRAAPVVTPPVSFEDWLDQDRESPAAPRTDQLPVVQPVDDGVISAQARSWVPQPWSPKGV